MSLDNQIMGVFVIALMIVVGTVSYKLGKRKSRTPKMIAVLGVVLSVIPLLGLIYLGALYFKADLPADQQVKD